MANETDRVFSDTELQEMRERSYEYGLPAYLQKDLDSYKAAMEAGDKIELSFLWCELYGSINSALINDGTITEDHANFLRGKFLY
jgi:hypothetical protein